MLGRYRRIFDPLYGVMDLSEREFSILMSPDLQRLRYVRMCNINSLLVTGASEISRFEHVLGVLRLAKEWCLSNKDLVSLRDQNNICAAALLHDFQTGPFGHSLQYVFEDNETESRFLHDDLNHGGANRFHQITDANVGFMGRQFCSKEILGRDWGNVSSLIKGEGLFGSLISGSIDLDNIDNVIRLAYHVGVADRDDASVALKLARDIYPTSNGLEISEESVNSLVRWQEIRHDLYELLLLDWAEFSAKAMLTKAMEAAVKLKIVGADSWLKTDLEFYSYLDEKSKGDGQYIGRLIKRIKVGDLYFPLVLFKSSSVNQYAELANIENKSKLEIELLAGLKNILGKNNRFDLIVHYILDSKKTDRAVKVVVRESKETKKIGFDSSTLLVGVFISFDQVSEEKIALAKDYILNFFKHKGLKDLSFLKDPMLKTESGQLELL